MINRCYKNIIKIKNYIITYYKDKNITNAVNFNTWWKLQQQLEKMILAIFFSVYESIYRAIWNDRLKFIRLFILNYALYMKDVIYIWWYTL